MKRFIKRVVWKIKYRFYLNIGRDSSNKEDNELISLVALDGLSVNNIYHMIVDSVSTPLTLDELKRGGWVCYGDIDDIIESVTSLSGDGFVCRATPDTEFEGNKYLTYDYSKGDYRMSNHQPTTPLREITLKDGKFYWKATI